jgi:hypothetical protein
MLRVIILLFSISFSFLSAELKIEKVLETTSINEYNQWIKENKLKYPALKPVLVKSVMKPEEKIMRYDVIYYTENGEEQKKETFEGENLAVEVPLTNDRVIITRRKDGKEPEFERVTVKNSEGEILFSLDTSLVTHYLVYLGIDLYLEVLNAEVSADERTTLKIFNEKGEVIGQLKGISFIDRTQNNYMPEDERYCVFRAYTGRGTLPVIMVDRNGKEVWRKNLIGSGPSSIFISKNGNVIGVNSDRDVYIYKEDGILVHKYNIFNNEKFGLINSALSYDGKWLVTALHSNIKFFDTQIDAPLWEDSMTLKQNSDTVKFVHVIEDSNSILVLGRSQNLYVFNGDGQLIKTLNLTLGKKLESRYIQRGKKIETIQTESDFLTQDWDSDVVGEYLIINKDTKGRRTQGLKRIVYRIFKE